jgi:hypothetical protein
MEKRCRDCKYYHTTRFGEHPCIDCMALSHWQPNVVQKQEQKDILVFKFNTNLGPDGAKMVNKWGRLLEEMRDKGIILLPDYIDLITMLPGDVDIKIYNSEGEELCLEQKKL